MKKFKFLLCIPFLFSILILKGSVFAIEIAFDDFSDLSGFNLAGSAATIGNPVSFNEQNVLRLTDHFYQSGSAFLNSPVNLSGDLSFSTFFSFQITTDSSDYLPDEYWYDPAGDGLGADGITFTVHSASSIGVTAGGNLGYGYDPNICPDCEGIQPSVAIEYDTWSNGDVDNYSGNHVGIDFNGSVDSEGRLVNVSKKMNDGDIWYSWVDYDGANELLEVRLSQFIHRPDDALLSHSVVLADILKTSTAYIGFTSGTGAAEGDHDIRSFYFNDTYKPIEPVPEPNTLLLLGIGLIGLVGVRRKIVG
jgi:hypothetical protein